MFEEAKDIVIKIEIPPEMSVKEFYDTVSRTIENYNEWGWGSNWPNWAHVQALRLVKGEIMNNIPEKYREAKPESD